MVRNKLAAVVAALGALQADVASALGLGEFTLNSALNQPLDAEIRLLNVGDLDKAQVIIKLASSEDFKNAGVIRDFFLTNLRFAVEMDGKGGGVIRVTSREAVVEPYLDLMVEARWPNGRLLREYTVLLDLPIFSDSQAEAAAPSVQEVIPDVTVEAKPAPMPAAPVPTQASVPVLNENRKTLKEGQLQPGENYRVRRDDTLWEIAAKARPSRKVSMQQTMVGIQRNNPEAFINGNINRLKAGAVLRLPTEQEVQEAVTRNQAVSEVAQHNRNWKAPEQESAPATEAPLQAAQVEPEPVAVASEEPRLTIAAADEGVVSGANQGEVEGEEAGTATNAEAAPLALQNELSQSQENLEKVRLENQDLNTRLDNLESKLATLQRLLELKDDQLAALQAGAAQSTAQDAPQAGGVAPEAGQEPEADQQPPVAAADADAATEMAEPAPATSEAAADEGMLAQLMANPLYTGAGAAIVLLLLLALRRRKEEEPEEPQPVAVTVAEERPAEPEAVAEPEPESEPVNEEELTAEVIDQLSEQQELEQAAADEEHVTSETGDAVAEADIYMAYGRYHQAMDLLNTAIAEEPSSELRLKLLEVCVEARDKQSFLAAYGDLEATGDEAAVAQAKELLSTNDDAAQWLDADTETKEEIAAEEIAELIEDDPAETVEPEESMLDADIEAKLEAELDEELSLGEAGVDGAGDPELDLSLDLEDTSDAEQQDDSVALDDALDLDVSIDLGEEDLDEEKETTTTNDLDFDLDLDGDLDSLAEGADLGELAAEFDEPEAESKEEPVAEFTAPEAEEESDDDYDFLADTDEVATKLNLARAYIDMGDSDGAKEILSEVQKGGSEEQQQEANELLERI